LEKFAAQLGLDSSTFNACLTSGKYATEVKQQTTEGQQRGVQGTPTFFVNGQSFEGVLPYNQLVTLIEAGQPH
jgi:protein-disulfide isomerase